VIEIIIGIAYLFGYIYVWRRVAYAMAHDSIMPPDSFDLMSGIIFGAFVAIVWPIALLFMAIKNWDGFFLPPADKKHEIELERREQKIKEHEQHIAELERQVGLR
jgi:hypothetical protein